MKSISQHTKASSQVLISYCLDSIPQNRILLMHKKYMFYLKKTENDQQLNHMRCFGCSNIQNKIFFTKEFDPW